METSVKYSSRHRLRDQLLRQIGSGTLMVGKPITSERKLARQYGISYMTARKAVSELVARGILARHPGRGTFVRRVPRERRTKIMVYLANPEIAKNYQETAGDFFTAEILQGIHRGGEEFGFEPEIKFMDGQENFEPADDTPRIFMLRQWDPGQVRELAAAGVPHVFINPPRWHSPVHQVGCDDGHGLYLATLHLLETGRRNIAYLGLPRSGDIIMPRYEGFVSALTEYGLKPFAVITDEIRTIQSSFHKVNLFLKTGARPEAIVAATDMAAIGAIMAIHENNLRVPDDVAVTGFDDIQEAAASEPPLTSVAKPRQQMGFEAVKFIKDWLDNPDNIPMARILKPELIIRDSSRAKSVEQEGQQCLSKP
jgi:DNA-binding LacI/PurR family transcriptional regulator